MGVTCVKQQLLVREGPQEECAKRFTVLVPVASGAKPIVVVRSIWMPKSNDLLTHLRSHVKEIHSMPNFQNHCPLSLQAANRVANCNLTAG